jgi:nucleotide-binding universal stress UspA family protein
MTNIAELKTDQQPGTGQPATLELTGFPLRVKEILAPTDLTKDSRKGLRYATALAKHFNAKLTILHVIEGLHSWDHGPGGKPLPEDDFQKLQVAGQKLSEIVEDIKKEHPAVEATEVVGSVCSHIVEFATLLKSDLIVVSTHNYPWFKRLMTGSDAEKIARHAPCPILIVHQREHDFVA